MADCSTSVGTGREATDDWMPPAAPVSSARDLRVLMVTHPLPTSEKPNTNAPVARQIESLRRLGVGIRVVTVEGPAMLKYPLAVPRLRRALAGVDLVHAHFAYCGWLARLQLRRPLVVSFMGDDLLGTPRVDGSLRPFSRLVVAIDRWFARSVDQIIVKSPEMAKVLAPLPCHVVPNGVDLELFRWRPSPEARRSLGLDSEAGYVLFPANPKTARKAFPIAVEAVRIAERRLRRPLRLLDLQSVAPERVPVLMNAADAVLLTSWVEGSPNVVKEAMACERPVVSVPVGDVPWLLEGVPGCWVREREPDALAEALCQAVGHGRSGGRDSLIQRGLDLETVARRIVTVYRLSLSGGAASSTAS